MQRRRRESINLVFISMFKISLKITIKTISVMSCLSIIIPPFYMFVILCTFALNGISLSYSLLKHLPIFVIRLGLTLSRVSNPLSSGKFNLRKVNTRFRAANYSLAEQAYREKLFSYLTIYNIWLNRRLLS